MKIKHWHKAGAFLHKKKTAWQQLEDVLTLNQSTSSEATIFPDVFLPSVVAEASSKLTKIEVRKTPLS